VAAGLAACVVTTAAPALAGDPPRPRAAADHDRQPTGYPDHTSDGARGQIVPPANGLRRSRAVRVDGPTWQVSPGVVYSQWAQTDARGPIQAHLLTVHLRTRGLRLDYADPGRVAKVAKVSDILAIDDAVAGVNGDFYDIGRTGAPLGTGVDHHRGLLHGRTQPNAAFYLDERGRPVIGDLPIQIRVVGHPDIAVSALNPPYVRPGTIGLYRKEWGRRAGYAMTQGQRADVRAVWVEKGRVVSAGPRLAPAKKRSPHREIKGRLLVARGIAAVRQLRQLRPGMRVKMQSWATGHPRMAITGNRFLIDDGVIRARDDRELHPRTAIGIDHDTGDVLLLVVDGRSAQSRGSTMVELANLMVDLGADEAINLDGGGSSTMVATGIAGRARVRNTPSDGSQRRVPNAIQVTYRPPRS
jgi:hypothetical protein